MSDKKINLWSGLINPFISSKGNSYDRVMSSVQDGIENHSLSPFTRNFFKGVILNGFSADVLDPTSDVSPVFGGAENIDWGDGVVRWRLRFTIHEQYYNTDIGRAFTMFYGKSPLQSGISEEERQSRIQNMPFCYTDLDNNLYNNLCFGKIVNIRERNGVFFVHNTLIGNSPRLINAGKSKVSMCFNLPIPCIHLVAAFTIHHTHNILITALVLIGV